MMHCGMTNALSDVRYLADHALVLLGGIESRTIEILPDGSSTSRRAFSTSLIPAWWSASRMTNGLSPNRRRIPSLILPPTVRSIGTPSTTLDTSSE